MCSSFIRERATRKVAQSPSRGSVPVAMPTGNMSVKGLIFAKRKSERFAVQLTLAGATATS